MYMCNIIFKKLPTICYKAYQISIFNLHFKYKSVHFYSDISIYIYVTKYRQY